MVKQKSELFNTIKKRIPASQKHIMWNKQCPVLHMMIEGNTEGRRGIVCNNHPTFFLSFYVGLFPVGTN